MKQRIKELHTFEGMGRKKVSEVSSGDICALVGIEGFEIGDTVSDINNPEPLPRIAIDEPTMSMTFTINDSPFFGKDGKFVTSRHIADRLTRELDRNLALRVSKAPHEDVWTVYGRGVLHLSVLIETMRREGYELQVGQPQVIIKEIDGQKCEPVELLTINVPEEYSSKIIDMVTRRRGEMVSMTTQNDRLHIEFQIPREALSDCATTCSPPRPVKLSWLTDSLNISPGKATSSDAPTALSSQWRPEPPMPTPLTSFQDRGRFFIFPQEEVYAGQVVGENAKDNDIVVNVTKSKKLTNMRASGADDKARIIPPVVFSLEEALEYIKEDEYVEVTPHHLRLRKIILDELERKRANKQ